MEVFGAARGWNDLSGEALASYLDLNHMSLLEGCNIWNIYVESHDYKLLNG